MNRGTPAFRAVSLARIIHQDVAHHLGSDSEKMRAITPSGVRPREEAQKCLLNQRGRLHRVILTLTAEVAARKTVQFRVDQRKKAIQPLVVPLAPTGWNPRDFACLLHRYPQRTSLLLALILAKLPAPWCLDALH